MWLAKKEWLVVIFSTLIIVPGIFYFFFNPYYNKRVISNPGLSDTMLVMPDKINDKKLVIKLAGVSSVNYALKLNLFYKQKNLLNRTRVHSETINIPAGTFGGSFTRNFYSKLAAEKAEIIFIPESKSAKGKVEIEAGIF